MTGVITEMERLIEVLEGRWECQVSYEPSPQLPDGGVSVGWEECRVGPGRWSILFDTHAHGESGDFSGAGVISWNSVQSSYDLHWLSTHSPEPGLFSGRWDGGNVVFDGHEFIAGQRFASRHSITDITPVRFLYTVDIGSEPKSLRRVTTIRYARG